MKFSNFTRRFFEGRLDINHKFEQEFLCQRVVDEEYESFVMAWTAYHKAANEVDGHLPMGDPDQRKLGPIAVRAGYEAMNKVMPLLAKPDDPKSELYKKWHSAKMEALRRLGL